jgi:hypothetical protein
MKLPLLLLAALFGSKFNLGACGSIRGLGERDPENSPPLEAIETADGATVTFFEAGKGTGVLSAASAVPKGIIDPIHEYLDKAGVAGSKTSMADLYVHLTGKDPSGALLEALERQKANEAGEAERKDWRLPNIEESVTPDATNTADEGGTNRQLCLNCESPVGSKQWWIDVACRSVTPYDWCRCLPYRTGNAYKVKNSDDFFQMVYAYRGDIRHKLEYWSCATGVCKWTYLVSSSVPEGWMSTIWGEGGGTWSYKGSTSFAEGDGYHLSWFDAEDSDVGCILAGLGGCHVCPSIA